MKTLAVKVKALLPMLEKRGIVYLYALFEREEMPGKWDLILSSEWSDKDSLAAIRLISDALVPKLNTDELLALSFVFIAPSHDPAVEEFVESEQARSGERFYPAGFTFMDIAISRTYVFRMRKVQREGVAA